MMQSNNTAAAFLDLFFSSQCMVCGEKSKNGDTDGICNSCLSQIGSISTPLCNRCGLPFIPEGGINHFCQKCLVSPPFFGIARAFSRYQGGLKEAIARFKYEEKIALGEKLGKLMAQVTYPDLTLDAYHLVMPVPLHPKRLRERGFNQSAILAQQVNRRCRTPVDLFSLRRHRATGSQVNLGLTERRRNVKGAFSLSNGKKVKNKSVLLVDDVYTSGATVNECAKVLLKAGAVRVDVLTLARAV
jgi:ComF family protein